jgi:hypothetical protein
MKMQKIDDIKSYCEKKEQDFLQKILQYIQPDGSDKSEKFRTLVDSWYGYYMGAGFVKRTGSVQWLNRRDLAQKRHHAAICKMHFISAEAKKVLNSDRDDHLIKDHSVPVNILRKELTALNPLDTEGVKTFLLDRYRLGVITKCEDNKLSGPLKSGFPSGRSTLDSLARYKEVGIFK